MSHKHVAILILLLLYGGLWPVRAQTMPRVHVTLVTDEADAILAILDKKAAGRPISDDDWQRLFSSEGYVRLKKREAQLKRTFNDDDFRQFVLSQTLLERREALADTLSRWKQTDVQKTAQLPLRYLPRTARIVAKIYPIIKPRENSFVFEVRTDPAIFLYIDPAVTKETFENTLAHELHHMGYGTACPSSEAAAQMEKLPKNTRTLVQLIGAFGEGFAMLAAAGGPDRHPHAVSLQEDRARWDRDIANFDSDLRTVEKFFLEVADGKLTDEKIDETAASFLGVQGPWYTVGWKMAVVIEKTFGRKRLIEVMCDQRKLLPTYDQAVREYNRKHREHLTSWSNELLGKLK